VRFGGLRRRKRDEQEGASPPESEGRSTRQKAIILLAAALPILLALYGLALFWSRPDAYGEEVRLDQFFAMTSDGRIQDAVILDADRRVIGESEQGPFWTTFGGTETAFSRVLGALEAGDVPTQIRQQWGKGLIMPLTALLPALLIINGLALLFLLVRGGGGGGLSGFGKSSARRQAAGESKISFVDVAGLDEVIEELAEIRDYLSAPERFLAMGASVPKGILLAGPPGCGKTLLARAVAGEAGVPFFSMSGSDFVEMYVGVGSARIRDLFKTAKASAPCIVFIDELDAVGRGRSAGGVVGQDERETTLNQLLVEMDGFEMATGVVVLAATNRVDVLDQALLRPGRFDRRVTIDRPDLQGRRGVLAIHARGKPIADGADLERIARATPGFSGADLASVVNEAALLTARRVREEIGQAELIEAVERVLSGPERRSRVLNERDRTLIAHHEAGHAVAAAALSEDEVVHKVSIVNRGNAGGTTWFTSGEELIFASRSRLEGRLAILLAGRAAEERLAGEPSSGSSDDLERATLLARKMVTELGMGELLLAHVSSNGGADDGAHTRISERVASEIDAEVHRLLQVAVDRARGVLEDHGEAWQDMARRLLEEESLEGAEIERALAGVLARRGPGAQRPVAVDG
jgi:cell division protease FtsH